MSNDYSGIIKSNKQRDYSKEYMMRMEEYEKQSLVDYAKTRNTIFELINGSYEVYRTFSTIIQLNQDIDIYNAFISDVFVNNVKYVYATIKLIDMGQYIQARVLYRNIYESLVIAKYSYISRDTTYINKYKEERHISLRSIFKNVIINGSKKNQMEQFWDELCSFSHFSVSSNSLLENGNIDKDEVRKSYEIAKILLIMNYHVLNSYYYSTNMKSQIERLIVDERGIRPSDFRREYRKTINDCKKEMTKYCKSVIRIFSLDWKIKF